MNALALAGLLMSSIVIAGADVGTTPIPDGDVEVKLTATVVRSDTVWLDLKLVNHTKRDLCFFPSLHHPRLFDKDGKDLNVYDPHPMVWMVPDEISWVQKDNEAGYFEYVIGPQQGLAMEGKPKDVAKAEVEVMLFDCIQFHELKIDPYFLNLNLKRFTLTATMNFRDAEWLAPQPRSRHHRSR